MWGPHVRDSSTSSSAPFSSPCAGRRPSPPFLAAPRPPAPSVKPRECTAAHSCRPTIFLPPKPPPLASPELHYRAIMAVAHRLTAPPPLPPPPYKSSSRSPAPLAPLLLPSPPAQRRRPKRPSRSSALRRRSTPPTPLPPLQHPW
jgi:hypothetical protein